MAKKGRPRNAASGSPVANHPDGFPGFFDKRRPRVITANPWAFLEHAVQQQLPKTKELVALAYVAQARDFYEAAHNHQLGSQPLLYYYPFLNLAKAALVGKGVPLPATAKHGITDPRANVRSRLRLEGQRVTMQAYEANHSQIFPEFVKILGGESAAQRTFRIVDLLGQVPVIHRTFTQVSGSSPNFLPLKSITVLGRDHSVWVRICLEKGDQDVKQVLPTLRTRRAFRSAFHQVASDFDTQLWFETEPEIGHARAKDAAIASLATRFAQLERPLSSRETGIGTTCRRLSRDSTCPT